MCISEDNLKLVALSHLYVVPRIELGSSSDLLGSVFAAEPPHWSTYTVFRGSFPNTKSNYHTHKHSMKAGLSQKPPAILLGLGGWVEPVPHWLCVLAAPGCAWLFKLAPVRVSEWLTNGNTQSDVQSESIVPSWEGVEPSSECTDLFEGD